MGVLVALIYRYDVSHSLLFYQCNVKLSLYQSIHNSATSAVEIIEDQKTTRCYLKLPFLLRDEPLIIVGGCRAWIFHLLFFLCKEALASFFFPRQRGTCFFFLGNKVLAFFFFGNKGCRAEIFNLLFFPRQQSTCFFPSAMGYLVFFLRGWGTSFFFFWSAPLPFFFSILPDSPPQ